MRRSQHIEWLSLIEVSGPFLAVSLLDKAFPQGLERVETPRRQKLRAAYDEWREALDEGDPELPALHREWLSLVLHDVLEYDQEVLVDNTIAEAPIAYHPPEHDVTFAPDLLVKGEGDEKPRLLLSLHPAGTDFEKVKTKDGWPVSLMERMVSLCRSTGMRLGLLTNGERWMLVNAPVGATSSHASWYARLWFQEPLTLKAFQSLLGVRRFFGPKDETLEHLLEKSLEHQEEVTDTLGQQVRRAVEVLVQCLDKADQDRNRELLRDVSPAELYEAGLTVMMRLVFILCAEERGLLLLGDPVYDECYAVSTLRGLLDEDADRHGPEVLERRHDAWARLLATFRAVYGGIEHEALRLPAMGGSLFDPDRFPFLEGRLKGTLWRDTPAAPLPIDNRTVLLLLEALQILEQPGGALLLSYRALDVEQIGHVYEGLLEHTVARVPSVTLGLVGSKKAKNPNVSLADLESARLDGEDTLASMLEEITQRSLSAIRNALKVDVDDDLYGRLLLVCGGDETLANRIRPFADLLRTDAWEEPIVYRADSFMVTLGADRRETGTHYTPKSLTETIVATTLEPVAYVGPAEGLPREEWRLKSSDELLDLRVCDPAMGSGAFLVQACRWLAERLVEAWAHEEAQGRVVTIDGDIRETLGQGEPMPSDTDERLIIAKRLVAERCLYGVDINPLAVELAKLSIWLVTLAKGRPFGFLDHNLRSGDSLLGIHHLDQLLTFQVSLNAAPYQHRLFHDDVLRALGSAIDTRLKLRSIPIRDVSDVEAMATLDIKAKAIIGDIQLVADALVGEALSSDGNGNALKAHLDTLAVEAGELLAGSARNRDKILKVSREALSVRRSSDSHFRATLNWPLEFPEVFVRERPGFDSIVGNPPFLGNRLWKSMIHDQMQRQASLVLGESPKKIDLCIVFHRRTVDLLRNNGTYGLLATTNISEGSSLKLGLAMIAEQGDLIFSIKSFRWPGSASVTAAVVAFYKGKFSGWKVADGMQCQRIDEKLEPILLFDKADTVWQPRPVPRPVFSFAGVDNSKGLAFVLESESPWFGVLRNEPNTLLRPYVSGEDITSHCLHEVKRWALDISDRSLEFMRQSYPRAHHFLTEVVQPTRTARELKSYKGLFDRWWQFWNHRADPYKSVREYETCIAYSKITKHPMCILADPSWIYTNKVVLIALQRPDLHAICLSSFFSEWLVARQGAKFGVGASLSLSIREAIDTFPPPEAIVSEKGVAAANEFDIICKSWSKENSAGVTSFADRLGDETSQDRNIVRARELLDSIDDLTAAAYGYSGGLSGRGCFVAPYIAGSKSSAFIVPEQDRREIVSFLTQENHAQCRDEVGGSIISGDTR